MSYITSQNTPKFSAKEYNWLLCGNYMAVEIIGSDVYIWGNPLTEEKGVTPEKVLLAG